MKTMILAAIAALSLAAQQAPVAAKPETPPAGSGTIPLPTANGGTPSIGVPLSTARIWRLNSKVQALTTQLAETEAGKALKAAQEELQAEQAALSAKCTAAGLVLDYDRAPGSPTKDDLVCVKAPAPPAEVKKEK